MNIYSYVGGVIMSENAEQCKNCCINPDKIILTEYQIIPEEDSHILADFFRIFGDVTRLKILQSLAREELCVCDISNIVEMGQSAVSHQLRILRNARLVRCRKDGKNTLYSLNDYHVLSILKQGIEHIQE